MANATWHLVRPAQDRPFVVAGDVIVGRSKEANLRISEGFVSRRHARLWLDGERLLLEDLGSANGTFVNGERITTRTRLAAGDRVCFDETEFHVELHGVRVSADPDSTVHRPADADPAIPEPGRADHWGGPGTRIAAPAGASGPTRKRTVEPAGADIDFDLEMDQAQAAAPAAAPPCPPTIDEPDFNLGLTSEALVAPRTAQPASSTTATGADVDALDLSLDLSLGSARLDDEPPPPGGAALATVIMGPEAPGHAGPATTPPEPDAVGVLGLSGPVEGHLYALAEGRVTIGRSPECDIMIEEGSVSKRHAELIIRSGHCRIHDISRANGVFVNGTQTEDSPLAAGDVLRLGRVEFLFDSYARLLEDGAHADAVPAWLWLIAGFVGAGAVLAVGALFVL